jgi:hypothetical protein
MKWWAKRLGGLAVASLPVELLPSWTVIVVVSLLIVARIGFAAWVVSSPLRTRRLARLIRAYRK